MLGALSIAFLGFLLGVRHALDPDHVVAVTAIAADNKSLRRTVMSGALWGLGHTGTILVVGGAMILFRLTVAPRVGLALEFGVALMLIVLGFQNLQTSRDAAIARLRAVRRPMIVGMVHGLAGSAAVTLLVLATVSEPRWALAYLALFGVGTVVGMALVTLTIAGPAQYALARWQHSRRWIVVASGLVSVAFGVALAAQLLGPGGLLSTAPSWTPR